MGIHEEFQLSARLQVYSRHHAKLGLIASGYLGHNQVSLSTTK